MPISEDQFHIPLVTAVVVEPNHRILELFRKPGMLTSDEWAELELYEAMQKEASDEFYEGRF